MRLKEEAKCGVVTLLGNHEAWMLRSLRDPTCHIWILALQSFATIRSYSTEAAAVLDREIERLGPRLIAEGLPLPYEAFFDSMPSSHLALLENLQPYHRTEDVVCVHGGILHGIPLHLQDPQTLVWGPDDFPDGYHGEDAEDSEARLKHQVPVRIGTRQASGVTILDVTGKLCGEEQCNALKEQVAGLLARPQTARIVLNLENVSGIDEIGFATLVKAFTDTRHRGGELKLVCPAGHVLRLLQLTKLITVFQVFATEAEALASFE